MSGDRTVFLVVDQAGDCDLDLSGEQSESLEEAQYDARNRSRLGQDVYVLKISVVGAYKGKPQCT